MKRNNGTLKWAVVGSLAGLAACVGAMYKTVVSHVERKFEKHLDDVAVQTFEGEGGLVLD